MLADVIRELRTHPPTPSAIEQQYLDAARLALEDIATVMGTLPE
jgi:hypothetical protein